MTLLKGFSKVLLIVAVIIMSIFLGALTVALVLQYGWDCSPGLIIARQVLTVWGYGRNGISGAADVVIAGLAIDSAIWFAIIWGISRLFRRRTTAT